MSVYKGEKLVAGGSIDTHFVRKPAWNKAVSISADQLYTGYTAPSDGMFVCTCSYSITAIITVNNVIVSKSFLTEQPNSGVRNSSTGIDLCVPVSKSDIIKSDAIIQSEPTYSNIAFVPFEDSTVSGVEVITPELIRNLHDPDWSRAESITADQLVAGYTVPKRGIIVGSIWSSRYTNAYNVNIEINNVSVLNARVTDKDVSYGNIQCPVCADDRVRLVNIPADYCSYKISFVPYKAQ